MSTGIEVARGVVHPWMCDEMGHCSTRFYLPFFDDGSRHFFAALGFTPQHLAEGAGFADVTTTQSYLAELLVGDLIVVHGAVEKLGTTSVTARYRMTRTSDRVVVAEQSAVTVQFDLAARKAMPVLPVLRDAIARMFPECLHPGS